MPTTTYRVTTDKSIVDGVSLSDLSYDSGNNVHYYNNELVKEIRPYNPIQN